MTDVLYIKVREDARVVSKSCHIAIGINEQGDRESIGLMIENAFLILLVSPFETLAIIVSLIALSIIIKFIPAIGFIFGISLSAFISLWGALHAFNKVLKSKRNT